MKRHEAVIFSCLLLFLGGCSSVVELAEKTADVWMDPSIPVGEPSEQLTTLALSMDASPTVNPNIYNDNLLTAEEGESATAETFSADLKESIQQPAVVSKTQPVAFQIIQLKESSLFTPSDTESVFSSTVSAWDSTYLTHDDSILIPKLSMHQAAQTEQEETIEQVDPLATEQEKKHTALAEADAELSSEATPIAFKIIQLKDNSLFLQADFESLFSDMETALGTTYLTHDDFMLIPSEFKFVEPFEVESGVRYVAVIAAYNDYANKQWKGLVKIKPKGKEYVLFLHFNEQQVVIKKQEL